MDIRNNVRINRTKMLDEAAIDHRPSHFIHTFLIFLLVYGIASLASEVIVSIPTAFYLFTSDAFWGFIRDYIAGEVTLEDPAFSALIANAPWWVTLFMIASSGALIGGAVIYCKCFEKRKIATLGMRKSNIALEYSVGAIVGIAMYSISVLIAYLCGAIEITGATFTFPIILFFVAFVIQGAAEEIFFRGYLMVSVARDYKVHLALLFSSAVFSLLHGANAGVSALALVNIFLFGVFEGIYVLKRGDIWGACAIHTMWNFMQGNIFGSNVSGISKLPSLFTMISNPEMKAANGGEFGLEGGFAVSIVLLIAIGVLLMVKPKQSELPEYEKIGDYENVNI